VLSEACVGTKVNVKSGRMAKHFQCNLCKGEFPSKDVQVNHILPVVPIEGFTSWDDVIKRMFCEKNGLEVLCIPCHKQITKQENEERKSHGS
jgi:5-methylcytosine-specific restriction endonuclease McrA